MKTHTPGAGRAASAILSRVFDECKLAEGGTTRGLNSEVAAIIDREMTLEDELNRVKAERDALLSALKWAQARLFIHEGNSDVYEAARAAIALTKHTKPSITP